MRAKVRVRLPLANLAPADIAHAVAADARQLVAAGRLDKGEVAARAGAFDGVGLRGFDVLPEGEEARFVADVDVGPGGEAGQA